MGMDIIAKLYSINQEYKLNRFELALRFSEFFIYFFYVSKKLK